MKKTLAAMAALALCGVASAQSSVTLFGVVDVGIRSISNKAERNYTLANFANPAAASIKASRTELANSGLSSSRLGFRGVEDLGGGLTAGFWLESPLNNDDGTNGLSAFSRRSTLSLAGAFGELRLGRDTTPVKLNDDQFDPFGGTGIGGTLIATAYSHSRVGNAVQYFLPKGLGGFYGNVMYAFHEKTDISNLSVLERDSKAGQYFGGRVGYANGPLDLAVAYGQLDGLTIGTANNTTADNYSIATGNATKNKILNAGVSYDFGVVKLFGAYSQLRAERDLRLAEFTAFNVNTKDKTQGYLVGVSVPVGAGLIRASYAQVKRDVNVPLFSNVQDPKANKFALGYQHNLSKRTALYATVARVSNKNGSTLGVLSASAMPAIPASPAGAAVSYTMKNSTGYEFGLRHSF